MRPRPNGVGCAEGALQLIDGKARLVKEDFCDGFGDCVGTCPTGALTFGNLMDPDSRVRRLADDPRAYQIMGYLNTKPAVIYLKKVTRNV